MTDTIAPVLGATQNPPAAPIPLGISVQMIEAAYANTEWPATPEQLEQILWLFRYARDNKLGGNATVGKLLDPVRDGSTIGRIFGAKYNSNLQPICDDIERLRTRLAQRSEVNGVPRVRLPWMTDEIHNFAEAVFATRSIGAVWGLNQSGKTTAIKAHVEGSRRRTIYVKMPDGAIKTEFLDACLEAVGISPNGANGEKKKSFKRQLTADTELIVDEFHQCWEHGALRSQVVEMVRNFRDDSGCSLLLVCTNLDGFTDTTHGRVLSQISNRGVLRLQVPLVPQAKDVAAILEGYRLRLTAADAHEAAVIHGIANDKGIGVLCEMLKIARNLATNQDEIFAPKHVVAASEYVAACAAGNVGKEGR